MFDIILSSIVIIAKYEDLNNQKNEKGEKQSFLSLILVFVVYDFIFNPY